MIQRILQVAGLLALAPALAPGQVLLGPERRVNTYTTSDQWRPAVAADPSGNFVVVWDSLGQDGSGQGVFARFHDATGAPIGAAEFRVNSYTTGDQRSPRIAATPSGEFIVVWESWGQDGPVGAIFARRYDGAGTPLGPEFQVSASTMNAQGLPAVAHQAGGNFVVTWEGVQADGSSYGIKARRYDSAGLPRENEIPVNIVTINAQFRAVVASDASGTFVVVWQNFDGAIDVIARRYDLFAPLGGEFRLNAYTTDIQSFPSVGSAPGGGFTAVWGSTGQDGNGDGIFGRRYDTTAAPVGGEFRVNAYTTGNQSRAAIAVDPGDRFAVAWVSLSQDGSGEGVFARHFDAQGSPEGPEFPLNTYVTGNQNRPAIAVDGSGHFVAVWVGAGQDGDGLGVFAQRFAPDLIFRDGFEDGTIGAWSSASTDGGDLNVSAVAGLKFTTAGLRGLVDDTAGIFVEDQSPIDENRYRARFYFDPNGFDPGEALGRFRTRLFLAFEENPTRRLAAIVLRRIGGQYAVMGRARRDDNSQYNTGFFPVSDGPHFVELDWRRASGPDANDGSFELWIDGTSMHATTTLDNSISSVDFVRLGALSVKTGASGTMFWDEFESRRQGGIGP